MLPLRSVGKSNFDKGLHNLTTLIQITTYINENCCIIYMLIYSYIYDTMYTIQMSAPPNRISELLHSMQSCISDVKALATANMLKLNENKTEHMIVTSRRTKHLHSLPTSITIGNAQIPF